MAGFSIITYKEQEILYADYRGADLEQMLQIMYKCEKHILQQNKPQKLLTNIVGAFAVPEFMKKVKESGRKTNHLVLKSAIVGVTGAKKILLNGYNLFTKMNTIAFGDEESAKEWLTKD